MVLPESIPLIYVLVGLGVLLLIVLAALIFLSAVFIFTMFPPDANDVPIEGENRKKDNDNDGSPTKNTKPKGRRRI